MNTFTYIEFSGSLSLLSFPYLSASVRAAGLLELRGQLAPDVASKPA